MENLMYRFIDDGARGICFQKMSGLCQQKISLRKLKGAYLCGGTYELKVLASELPGEERKSVELHLSIEDVKQLKEFLEDWLREEDV